MPDSFLRIRPQTLFWILSVALLARFFCSGFEPFVSVDSGAYLLSAKALMSGNWADFFVERTPGYPLLMMKHMWLLNQLYGSTPESLLYNALVITQSMLGILLALLVAESTTRLFSNDKLGLVAGLLAALSPNLLHYEHAILTETLYAFSLSLYVWTLVRFWETRWSGTMLLWGFLAGWLLWIKPLAIIIPALSLWFFHQTNFSRKQLALYLAPVAVFYLSWSAFQYQTHGIFSLSASGTGYQLYKVIDFIDMDSPLEHDYKQVLDQRRRIYPPKQTYEAVNDAHVLQWRSELSTKPTWQIFMEDNERAKNIAFEAIREHPLQYLLVTGQSFIKTVSEGTAWDPQCLYWYPVLLLGILGTFLLWAEKKQWTLPLLLAGLAWAHLLVYPVLTVGDARYRIPQEPLFIILAVYAASRLAITAKETSPAA